MANKAYKFRLYPTHSKRSVGGG
ncbi:helix-turn-helix domain-containing protein [Bacillus smithii]